MYIYNLTPQEAKRIIRPIRIISTTFKYSAEHFLQSNVLSFIVDNDMKIGIEYQDYPNPLEPDQLEVKQEIKHHDDIRLMRDYMNTLYIDYDLIKLIFESEDDAMLFKLTCL